MNTKNADSPAFNRLHLVFEVLDVDDGVCNLVVPVLRLNDQSRKFFLQSCDVFLESLGVDQPFLEVLGGGNARADLLPSLFNVIPALRNDGQNKAEK